MKNVAPPPPAAIAEPAAATPAAEVGGATFEEDNPFAVEAEPEAFAEAIEDDPFAEPTAEVHDAGAERDEIEAMLANARAMIASLETAIERARDNEKRLAAKLATM
jgi:hypothetical protein